MHRKLNIFELVIAATFLAASGTPMANPLVVDGPMVLLVDLNDQSHKLIGGYIDSESVEITTSKNGATVRGVYHCQYKKKKRDSIDILIPVPISESEIKSKSGLDISETPKLLIDGVPAIISKSSSSYNALKVDSGDYIYFRMFFFRHAASKRQKFFKLNIEYKQRLIYHQGDSSIVYVPFIPSYFEEYRILKHKREDYKLVFVNSGIDSTKEYSNHKCPEVPVGTECSEYLTNRKPFIMNVRKRQY